MAIAMGYGSVLRALTFFPRLKSEYNEKKKREAEEFQKRSDISSDITELLDEGVISTDEYIFISIAKNHASLEQLKKIEEILNRKTEEYRQIHY